MWPTGGCMYGTFTLCGWALAAPNSLLECFLGGGWIRAEFRALDCVSGSLTPLSSYAQGLEGQDCRSAARNLVVAAYCYLLLLAEVSSGCRKHCNGDSHLRHVLSKRVEDSRGFWAHLAQERRQRGQRSATTKHKLATAPIWDVPPYTNSPQLGL